jgi:hypothetical protein
MLRDEMCDHSIDPNQRILSKNILDNTTEQPCQGAHDDEAHGQMEAQIAGGGEAGTNEGKERFELKPVAFGNMALPRCPEMVLVPKEPAPRQYGENGQDQQHQETKPEGAQPSFNQPPVRAQQISQCENHRAPQGAGDNRHRQKSAGWHFIQAGCERGQGAANCDEAGEEYRGATPASEVRLDFALVSLVLVASESPAGQQPFTFPPPENIASYIAEDRSTGDGSETAPEAKDACAGKRAGRQGDSLTRK